MAVGRSITTIVSTNRKEFQKEFRQDAEKIKIASVRALKGVGYMTYKGLKKMLETNGGRDLGLNKLQVISQYWYTNKGKQIVRGTRKSPTSTFHTMGRGIFYNVKGNAKAKAFTPLGDYTYKTGFIDESKGRARVYTKIAFEHAMGFSKPVTQDIRKTLIGVGGGLSHVRSSVYETGRKKRKQGMINKYSRPGFNPYDAKYFFLRKSTTQFMIPKREVIGPYWAKNKVKAEQKYREFFDIKMAGGTFDTGGEL